MFVPPAARITGDSEESRVLCLQKEIRILILFRANDGGRSSMVEPQIVVLVVAGSSPVGHPLFKSQNPNPRLQNSRLEVLGFGTWNLGF